MKKPQPVLVWMSVLAGLQIFAGSAASVSLVQDHYLAAQIFALAIIAIGAAQGGIQFYVQGQVTPTDNVVEQVITDGRIIAGPANDVVTPGTTVREVGEMPVAEKLLEAQHDLQAYHGDHGAAGPSS